MSSLLIVEDGTPHRIGLPVPSTWKLKANEVTVAGRRGGAETIAERPQVIDAMILDIMLPGMDGFAVCRRTPRARLAEPILIHVCAAAPKMC